MNWQNPFMPCPANSLAMECTKERQQWEKNNHKAKNIGTYNWNLNAVIVIIPTERLQLTQEHQLPPNHPTSLSAPRSKWGKSTVWKYYRKISFARISFSYPSTKGSGENKVPQVTITVVASYSYLPTNRHYRHLWCKGGPSWVAETRCWGNGCRYLLL